MICSFHVVYSLLGQHAEDIQQLNEVRAMSDLDAISSDFMGNPEVFAEIFNQVIHKGQQVIQSDCLQEADPNLVAYVSDRIGKQTKNKRRDLLKTLAARWDNRQIYLMLGIESQSDIDYSMPMRVMEYDLKKYIWQVQRIDEERGGNGSPFTSRLKRGELLVPVITVVVYFGVDPWDGPMCLHDMLAMGDDPADKAAVGDYKMHLIQPAVMTEEQAMHFKTGFRNVVQVMRCARDPEALAAMMREDKSFQHLNYTTAAFIGALTRVRLRFMKKEQGEVNMLPAFEELIRRENRKGLKAGMEKGLERGMKKGRLEGMKKGRLEEQTMNIAETIRYQMQKNTPTGAIVDMLTNIFKLSPDEAQQRIQQVTMA